jgi:ribosomal-protein-alanine N-acetyltransferase
MIGSNACKIGSIKLMELRTNRLILREWTHNDVDDLIDGLNNLEVAKWLAYVPHPYTKQNAEDWIKFCLLNSAKGKKSSYEFAIELASERRVIGGTSVDRIDAFHGIAGGGIWIHAKYQGKGFGNEAFGERIRFAFEDLKLRRLNNGFFDGNQSSLKMQERFGYKLEGRKRKAFRCMADGQLKDELTTGLLVEEWKR